MSSSNFKIFRRFSTPSAPNVGIHDLFEHSDQMEYLHKCSHCGYWNLLDYSDYTGGENSGNIKQVNPDGVNVLARTVQPGTFQFVCSKCGKPLERWYNGSFVAKYPSRTANMIGTRGYRLSQMNCVWIDL